MKAFWNTLLPSPSFPTSTLDLPARSPISGSSMRLQEVKMLVRNEWEVLLHDLAPTSLTSLISCLPLLCLLQCLILDMNILNTINLGCSSLS